MNDHITVPLYRLAHGRTGDKGNRSNISVIAWHPALWDAICHEDQEPASPPWHDQVLQDRRQKIDSGAARFLSLDEVEQRLRR